MQRNGLPPALIIFTIALVSFLPFLGLSPLFDWDEINFAESAREMLVTGNYHEVQINYQPFYEKPPLFFWMQAFSMYLFGVGEWAARLPNVIAGYLSLLGLFYLGKWMRDQTMGYLLVLLAAATWLPAMYFRTGIIDPWFNLFILAGIALYPVYLFQGKSIYPAWLSGLCIGLAVLTKGPVAILMYGITLVVFMLSSNSGFAVKFLMHSAIACCIPLTIWFGGITWLKGPAFIEYFIQYQIELFTQPVAGHKQPWFYHFVVVFLGCFPVSLLWFRSMRYVPVFYKTKAILNVMRILFWSVLIIFSISETKIVHYSALAWIPGVIIAGIWLRERLEADLKSIWNTFRAAFAFWGLTLGLAVFGLGLIMPDLLQYQEFIGDKFIKAGLKGDIQWTGLEVLPGLFLCLSALLLLFFGKRLLQHSLPVFTACVWICSTIFLHAVAFGIAPRIAEITQGPAITFYKAMQGREVLLHTEGFKSYAHYFYGAVMPVTESKSRRPVWMIMRADRVQEDTPAQYPEYREAWRKGGFVFYLKP